MLDMWSTPSFSSILNWIVLLCELDLSFFSIDELEGSYSPVHGEYSLLYQICRRLIFRVSLALLGSNFYYDNAFT